MIIILAVSTIVIIIMETKGFSWQISLNKQA